MHYDCSGGSRDSSGRHIIFQRETELGVDVNRYELLLAGLSFVDVPGEIYIDQLAESGFFHSEEGGSPDFAANITIAAGAKLLKETALMKLRGPDGEMWEEVVQSIVDDQVTASTALALAKMLVAGRDSDEKWRYSLAVEEDLDHEIDAGTLRCFNPIDFERESRRGFVQFETASKGPSPVLDAPEGPIKSRWLGCVATVCYVDQETVERLKGQNCIFLESAQIFGRYVDGGVILVQQVFPNQFRCASVVEAGPYSSVVDALLQGAKKMRPQDIF